MEGGIRGDLVPASDAVERIVRRTREVFSDFSAKRSQTEPNLLRSVVARQRTIARTLGRLALFAAGRTKRRGMRVAFLSARFEPLISAVRNVDPLVIGNVRDYRIARKLSCGFAFSGDLFAACYPIIEGRAGLRERRVVSRWLDFLWQQADVFHLVVPNDTLPLSTLLVTIANECPNVLTICVQHGLYSPSFELDDIDGRNCRINLVYDDHQRAIFERRLPGATVEVMGLPSDFRPSQQHDGLPSVILVGTGTPEQPGRYERSLSVFSTASAQLHRAGIQVEYRPHPTEPAAAARRCGAPRNRMTKEELLGTDLRVFVGFSSTLLYEAACAGHGVVLLQDEELPDRLHIASAVELSSASLELLPDVVQRASAVARASEPTSSLRDRFYSALDRAASRLRSGA